MLANPDALSCQHGHLANLIELHSSDQPKQARNRIQRGRKDFSTTDAVQVWERK
jgi:hypothetical protein